MYYIKKILLYCLDCMKDQIFIHNLFNLLKNFCENKIPEFYH